VDANEKSHRIELKLAEGLTTARIQSLSDNVFAFAATLLTLNLFIPNGLPSEHINELFLSLWPQFLTYFMSFMVLGIFWVGTNNLFHWIKHLDRKSLWINILFLSFIVLIPFTTAILRTYYTETIAVVAYGFNMVICGLAMLWFWLHATTQKHLIIETGVSKDAVSIMKYRIIVPVGLVAAVTLFAPLSPVTSLFLFAGLFVLATMPTNSDHIVSFIADFLHERTKK
jgi:uncharacterized membrane protein